MMRVLMMADRYVMGDASTVIENLADQLRRVLKLQWVPYHLTANLQMEPFMPYGKVR